MANEILVNTLADLPYQTRKIFASDVYHNFRGSSLKPTSKSCHCLVLREVQRPVEASVPWVLSVNLGPGQAMNGLLSNLFARVNQLRETGFGIVGGDV